MEFPCIKGSLFLIQDFLITGIQILLAHLFIHGFEFFVCRSLGYQLYIGFLPQFGQVGGLF